MINEREIILDVLMKMDGKEPYRKTLLRDTLDKIDYLDEQKKAFIKRVVEGTTERRITLDYCIGQFASLPVSKQKPLIRSLLRMSTYQILFMDAVPDSAAVNEAVKLAQQRKFGSLKGFVNGTLRNISRNKTDLKLYPELKHGKNESEYLSIRYSVPDFLCKMWIKMYGFEDTEELLKAFLLVRPVIIRMDERLSAKEISDLVSQMQSGGTDSFDIKESTLLPYAYLLENSDNVRFLPGYEEGMWMVQDLSSMLVTEIAGIKKGDTVIDVCSAPGGKSLHAAAKLGGTGKVISRDLTENKCELIRDNCERMNASNVEVEAFDATKHDETLESKADVLYCDLPCSGLGIIGRKNDIRYSVSKDGLKDLCLLQKEIIKAVWDYVKPGGTLMYSTCTINKFENEDMVKWITDNFPFETVSIDTDCMPGIIREEKRESLKKGYIQLLPQEFGTDGFFMAKFVRKNSKE